MDDLAKCMNTCIKQWKNVGPKVWKKMFTLFAVAGIFLAVCWHGHVLMLCDMIRSGELYTPCSYSKLELLTTSHRMKYPILQLWINLLTSMDMCLGYNIMCTFIKTLTWSCLGMKVATFWLSGVIPFFHGYAHNQECQCNWHPMYMKGVGLENFEKCKQTFTKSNELAGVTRLASSYHWHQHIDKHFAFS